MAVDGKETRGSHRVFRPARPRARDGTATNECTCYHPLFVFKQFGDLEGCSLRGGNVQGADGWENVAKPVVAGFRDNISRLYFRADANLVSPDFYEYLESERIKYAIRPPASRILQERIGYMLTRPVGRPQTRCGAPTLNSSARR